MDTRSTSLALLVALALLAPTSRGQEPAEALDWLAGHWCGGEGGERLEEHWLAPAGGELLGVSRTVRGGRTSGFEFLRIAAVDGVPTYLAQPGGRPATAFARSAGGERWVRFENPRHDFPTRIEYRRDGDALHAEIAGPGDSGQEQVIGFDYRRCEG